MHSAWLKACEHLHIVTPLQGAHVEAPPGVHWRQLGFKLLSDLIQLHAVQIQAQPAVTCTSLSESDHHLLS